MPYRDALKQQKLKVSVVTPVYNAEKYLAECIESLLNQTLKECEFIFVEDGSVDHSLDILRRYEQLDSRIKVVTQKNAGAGIARNNGMAHANGEYIAFLDSDDIMRSDALEKFYNRAEELDVDMVISDAAAFSDDVAVHRNYAASLKKEYLPDQEVFSRQTWPNYLMQTTGGMPWGKLYRRRLIEENGICFPCLPRSEDLCLVYWAMALAKGIAVLDEELIYYRIVAGSGSLEDLKDKSPTSCVDAYKILHGTLQRLGVADEMRLTFVNSMLRSISYNLRTFRTGAAFCTMVGRICEDVIPYFAIDLTRENDFYFQNDLHMMQEIVRCGSGDAYLHAEYKSCKREIVALRKELKALQKELKALQKEKQSQEKELLELRREKQRQRQIISQLFVVPRKLRSAYKLWKTQGLKNTISYAWQKLKKAGKVAK